ncbi:MAG: M1 family aminopeptidase [Candidatus Krumholzibacteriia bacterium]
MRTVLLLLAGLLAALPVLAQFPGQPLPGQLPDSRHPGRVWESERRTAALFAQAAAKGLGDPEPNQLLYDVTSYDLDLDVDLDAEMLTGTVSVGAVVVGQPIDQLVLDLLRTMTCDAVRVAGQPAVFDHPLDLLTIDLDRVYQPGEHVRVAVDYHGDPATGGDAFGWSYAQSQKLVWSLSEPYGARSWWPCKDLNDDKADSLDVRVVIDQPYVVASNGVLVSEESAAGRTTFHWRSRYPIATYLVSITGYPYARFTDTYVGLDGGTLPIENFVVPAYEQDARAGYGQVPAMITAFREGFGEYPFMDEKYGHAHFTWGGGMEHQTCTSMIYWFHGQNIIAHELAHQWWGDLVTCADFHHIWLNEGFATWSEAYWHEQHEGWAAYMDELRDNKYTGGGTIYVENPDDFSTIFDLDLTYNKASWVVHMLRGVMGDAGFFAGLQLYRERFAYASATTEDLQAVMEEVSGRDLTAFFQQWIYGEGYPRYRFAYTLTPQPGSTRIDLRIEQLQTAGPFVMPVRLRLYLSDGSQQDLVVENTRRDQYFILDGPAGVVAAFLDPDEWILRTVVQGAPTDAPPAAATVALAAYPNPFNPRTTLRLTLPVADRARVEIFDSRGRLVRRLLDGALLAGVHEVVWEGRDDEGRALPSGMYLARLTAAGAVTTRALGLVK